ncbi:glycosyltransferase family 9 protein [Segetibacter sp.]|jgi:ADP-heptose:LPS heptosyltransferase|uniref:glycosyltransferase family 9 protein n=1 Tax=Segetibacter sp. TaxID=2231182 RepID=UPI002620AACB|nr:glycosyltransferase family 9 protein [Segetibacter sp.]MCW3081931.1 glycosyl transferase family 9 [Segetibacter sp.]
MLQSDRHLKNIQKIAILRANAVGDFIVILPAIKALRSTYPDAEIVLLGKPWHQQFLIKDRCGIDRVIVVPVKKGIRNETGQTEDPIEVEGFVNQMRREQFDVVLNFQGNGISANPFIKQFGAKLTAGLTCEKAEKLDRSIDYYYYQSEVVRFLEVVKLIGATTTALEPELNVLQEDENEVADFLSILKNKSFIVLHPIAMDTRRMWPLENYAGLSDELRQRSFEVVFTGAPEDREIVDDIIYNTNYSAINACGDFSLGGLAALLSKAALMISADTGPLHLARAVNTSTVGFYWAPNLINWGPLTRSIHRPLISWKMECPICGTVPNDPYPFEPKTDVCDHPVSFVSGISIEQVLTAVEQLLPPEAIANDTNSVRDVAMKSINN